MVIDAIAELRENFDTFWEKVLKKAELCGVDKPQLPRKRKLPRDLEVGNSSRHIHHESPKSLYWLLE